MNDEPLLVRLGNRLDQLPFSPIALAPRVNAFENRRTEQNAGRDPAWRNWLARHQPTDVVAVEDLEERLALLETYRRAGLLSRVGSLAERSSFRIAAYRVVTAWQLARRGWAGQDTWNLKYVACRRLGAQLLHLADVGNGWPGPAKFSSPEEWTEALRQAGNALSAYASSNVHEQNAAQMARALNEATEALRWVADHLEHLWW